MGSRSRLRSWVRRRLKWRKAWGEGAPPRRRVKRRVRKRLGGKRLEGKRSRERGTGRIPWSGSGSTRFAGDLRLRKNIRFADLLAPLRMTSLNKLGKNEGLWRIKRDKEHHETDAIRTRSGWGSRLLADRQCRVARSSCGSVARG